MVECCEWYVFILFGCFVVECFDCVDGICFDMFVLMFCWYYVIFGFVMVDFDWFGI